MEQGSIIDWLSVGWAQLLVVVVYKQRLSFSGFSEGQRCIQQSNFVDSETNVLSHCHHRAYYGGGGMASGEKTKTNERSKVIMLYDK